MKTLEDLYKEILADQELKAQCGEAIKAQKLDEFLKAHECEATMEEVKAFLESKKEVAADELGDVAGGGCNVPEILCSVLTVSIGCGVVTLISDCAPGKLVTTMCPSE